MQALIDLCSPSGTLTSLHEFHNSIEGHIRSLASLGKSQDSYGSLLVIIILGKIPAKIKQNLARVHGRQEWKIDELQEAILNEIYILEAGSQTDTHPSPLPPTASFHTGAANRPIVGTRGKPVSILQRPSPPSTCDVIKDPRQHTDIVHQEKLCFNCMGHYKVSLCNSKHRCYDCKQKHHTSLCSYEQQPNGQHPKVPTGQQNTGAATSHPIPTITTTQQLSGHPPLTRPVNSQLMLLRCPHDLATITYHTEQCVFT